MPILCALGNYESRCDQYAGGNEKRQLEMTKVEQSTSYQTGNEYQGILGRRQYGGELLGHREHT